MRNIEEIYLIATGGRSVVQDDWLSPSALRPLIFDDPCLLWLKHHGHLHGFEEDPQEGGFLQYIMQKGCEFEAAWVKNCAPASVQCIADDKDVRVANSVWQTLQLMQGRTPVITKAALWWAPSKIYGTADVICLASWLRNNYPELSIDEQGDRYVVIDLKFTTKLESSQKRKDLAVYSNQVRLYSYMLGHLQGYMPQHAYIISRDTILAPTVVVVDLELNHPLDSSMSELLALAATIKRDGAGYAPWIDSIVKPDFSNHSDEPWTSSKEIIGQHLMGGRPLEWLPHIGKSQANELQSSGVQSIDELLEMPTWPAFESLRGVQCKTARRIRAVLEANRTGRPSAVRQDCLPPTGKFEGFIDFEFLSNLNIDWEHDWPAMRGCPMVFMIGLGWTENGRFRYQQFTASEESHDAEKQMFIDFLEFLSRMSLGREAVLYHWSHAERTQADQAANRTGLKALTTLPLYDLQKVVLDLPVALPGCWDFGLKSFAKGVGAYDAAFATDWPTELQSGLNAMCLGWSAYSSGQPLQSVEMQTLSAYLEVDCRALHNVLGWLRHSACTSKAQAAAASGWYRYAMTHSITPVLSRGSVRLHTQHA